MKKEDILQNLRSLTFAKNNIETNVNEIVLFKNYKERFECSLHLWLLLMLFARWPNKNLLELDNILDENKVLNVETPHFYNFYDILKQ